MSDRHEEYLEFVNAVLDKVKDSLGFLTDSELAEWLGEHKVNISRYRSGARIMNDWMLLKACDAAGYSISDALNMILRYKSFKAEVRDIILTIAEGMKGK